MVIEPNNFDLRQQKIFFSDSLRYYSYFGSRDYNGIELIEKIKEKINSPRDHNNKWYYFEICQIFN